MQISTQKLLAYGVNFGQCDASITQYIATASMFMWVGSMHGNVFEHLTGYRDRVPTGGLGAEPLEALEIRYIYFKDGRSLHEI